MPTKEDCYIALQVLKDFAYLGAVRKDKELIDTNVSYLATLIYKHFELKEENEQLKYELNETSIYLEQHEKALDKACSLLSDYSGSCPNDTLNVDLNCENKCDNQTKECWKEWCFNDD